MANIKIISMTKREIEDSIDTMSMLHDKYMLIRNNMGIFEWKKKKRTENTILLLRALIILLIDADKNNKFDISFDGTMFDVFITSVDFMLDAITSKAWLFKNNDAKNALINIKNVLNA